MHRQLDHDLARVRSSLLEMAGRVEQMIADAERALRGRDEILAERVIRADEEVDRLEKRIDQDCLVVLALRDPKAVDFRFVVAVQKIVGDLERMGDCAVNVAQAVRRLAESAPLATHVDLPRLSDMVRGMVRGSLDAFVRKDPDQAREICRQDDEVDALYHRIFQELVVSMEETSAHVSRALQLLLIAKNLERIADHATNVAEDVIFFLEAEDVRHRTPSSLVEPS